MSKFPPKSDSNPSDSDKEQTSERVDGNSASRSTHPSERPIKKGSPPNRDHRAKQEQAPWKRASRGGGGRERSASKGRYREDGGRGDRPWKGKPREGGGRDDRPWKGKPREDGGRGDRPWKGKPREDGGRDRPWKGKPREDGGRRDRPWKGKPREGGGRDDRPWKGKPREDGGRDRPWKGRPREDSGGRDRPWKGRSFEDGGRSRSRMIEIQADSWSPRGEASLMRDDRRMLVWEGIVGERATVEIKHAGSNQDYAHFQSAENVHPSRRAAPCTHFYKCGGCPLMHIKPEGQALVKLQMLQQALEVEFLSEHTPEALIVGPPKDYRRQFKLTIGATRDRGNIRIGVRSRQGYITPISECLVITPELKKLMKKLAHAIVKEGGKGEILPYTDENPLGLRHVVARQSEDSGDILVVFVVTHYRRVYEELADWLIDADLGVTGVALHFNREPGNAIFTRDERGWIDHDVLRGSHVIEEEINGIRYNVGIGDFFQVNTGIAARLQKDLVAASMPFSGFPMVDLYCGVGFFSLALARAHGHVYGVEFLAGAVERARENASLNGLKARFFSDDVADGLPRLHDMLRRKRPFVVVDPARRGLEEDVIEELIALNPAGIAYISCNPRTFARDLKQFLDHGFSLDSLKAYDMIPQSSHVEQFAILLPPDFTEKGRPKAPKRRIVT